MANDKMIWAYWFQLSLHMWDDQWAEPRGWYLPTRYEENNGCDPELWDEMVEFIKERKFNLCVIDVGDGMQFESHPEISAPDAWSKDFLREKLRKMRKAGIEPIPKLNFSAAHDTWLKEYSHMISTPAYYQVRRDVIREVFEVFDNPRLFHLGMDEETAPNQAYQAMSVVRTQSLWWHDIWDLFDICDKLGTRPWVFADPFFFYPEEYAKNMSRSVLQSNWFYGIFKEYPEDNWYHQAVHAYEKLDALGFDQIPVCSTYAPNDVNTFQTLAMGKDRLNPDRLKGYMTVPWSGNKRDQEYVLKNDAHQLYLARKKVYPETLS